ncbi:hypothetical protein TYRP_022915 [Tyrophagus putrescentiae]|nr:hypothetical protein TYRP_022915 [Tyrophagus putrescentiae]
MSGEPPEAAQLVKLVELGLLEPPPAGGQAEAESLPVWAEAAFARLFRVLVGLVALDHRRPRRPLGQHRRGFRRPGGQGPSFPPPPLRGR